MASRENQELNGQNIFQLFTKFAHVKPATFPLSTQNIVNSSNSTMGGNTTSGKFELLKFSGGRDMK